MDLSFPHFDRDAELTVLPGDLAVLMVGVAARQAASPTALVQASVGAGAAWGGGDARLFAPLDGAFNGAMARALVRWREE